MLVSYEAKFIPIQLDDYKVIVYLRVFVRLFNKVKEGDFFGRIVKTNALARL